MNREEIDGLMAEYLGGEIDEADRRRFEAVVARDPDLAAEVKALSRTLETMRFAGPERASESASSSPAIHKRNSGWSALLRYAAAMVLAFFAGYVSYSVIHGPEKDPKSEDSLIVSEPLQEEKSPNEWEDTFVASYSEEQGRSSLARSWIAFSRAMHD